MQGAIELGTLAAKVYNPNPLISDRKLKSGTGHMANAAKALKQIEQTPVHDGWTYDPAKGGA